MKCAFASRFSIHSWLAAGLLIAVGLVGNARAQGNSLPPPEQLLPLAKKGDVKAQYQLAVCYDQGLGVAQDSKEANKWLSKAAKAGSVEAQILYAFNLTLGEGASHPDTREAIKWYQKAADQGSADAQYKLGFFYEKGIGLKAPDATTALAYYSKAADQGILEAQLAVGRFNYTGTGTDQNYAEAAKWFRKLADKGMPVAQLSLGNCYLLGQGVPRDYVEAYKWFCIAASSGSDDAVKRRDSIASLYKLTPDQVADGEKRARDYKP